MASKPERDIEKDYPRSEFIAKLQRLADDLEKGEQFEIQIAGERLMSQCVRHTTSRTRGTMTKKRSFQIVWSPN
jgi:hypothetical protein